MINENEVSRLLRQIYKEDPWKINPDLPDEDIMNASKYIVTRFLDTERVEKNFDVAPGIIFDIDYDDQAKRELESFRLPVGTTVSGVKDWQKLFGKETDTGAWPWKQLAGDWEYSSVYEFLFAKLIRDAIKSDMPRGVLLRSVTTHELYRVTLRRYEMFASGRKYRFHLTAAESNLPFDLPSDLYEKKETVLYHLVNLTWYFRRRFVDNLYNQLLALAEIQNADRARYTGLFDDIKHELMDIQAQSIIRRVDSPYVVRNALGRDDPTIRQLMDRATKWYQLQPEIFKLMDDGPSKIKEVVDKMYELSKINFLFYQTVAQIYFDSSKTLEPPSEPG